jgi:hypothetical protein
MPMLRLYARLLLSRSELVQFFLSCAAQCCWFYMYDTVFRGEICRIITQCHRGLSNTAPPSRTFCTFLYSSSKAFCISKSSWRSFFTRCCSMSRITPLCIAYWITLALILQNGKRILKVEERVRRCTYCFLRLLLEMHEEYSADGEEGCARKSELRCAGHDVLFSQMDFFPLQNLRCQLCSSI